MTIAPVTGLIKMARTLVDAGSLRILLTDDPVAVQAAQRLRYDVFAAEPGFSDGIGDHATGRDADRFDDYCEHLLAWHDDHGVIGCARLLPPPRAIAAGGWYSSTEFELSDLDPISAATVEMGRACVLDGHRSGSVTALLWAAVLRYLEESGYRYLMGSVSMPLSTADGSVPRGAGLRGARDVLLADHGARWRAHPLQAPVVDGVPLDHVAAPEVITLPPLMRAYLRLGARVCGDPAIDPVFDVGDFLTILDRDDANDRYLQRLRCTIERLGGAA